MQIKEVAEYVVQYCFRKYEPPTMLLLNCYLFLMNAYSLREYKKPLTSDAEFLFDKKYPYVPWVFHHYRSYITEIVPLKNYTNSEMQRASDVLNIDGFLDELIKYNKENPFKIYAMCGEYTEKHRPLSDVKFEDLLKDLLRQ